MEANKKRLAPACGHHAVFNACQLSSKKAAQLNAARRTRAEQSLTVKYCCSHYYVVHYQ